MTQTEWQTETVRIAAEIVTVEAVWKGLRERGDWDNARLSQDRFHALRTQQAALVGCEPDKAAGGRDPRDMTQAAWDSEGDWLAHEIGFTEIEWKGLREAGDWTEAGVAQDRYHLLRKQQATHVERKPETTLTGDKTG